MLYTDEATNAKSGKKFVEWKKMGQLNARKGIQQRSEGVYIHNQIYMCTFQHIYIQIEPHTYKFVHEYIIMFEF